ncbi:hypothetical protein D9M73_110220 [compost metagenome]
MGWADLCVQIPVVAAGRSHASAAARADRTAQKLDRALPGAHHPGLDRAGGDRPHRPHCAFCLVRLRRVDRFGDAGRGDRCVADRCGRRTHAGRTAVRNLPARLSHREHRRRGVCAVSGGAHVMADGLSADGVSDRGDAADRLGRARYRTQPRCRSRFARPARRDRAARARHRAPHCRVELGVGDRPHHCVHDEHARRGAAGRQTAVGGRFPEI